MNNFFNISFNACKSLILLMGLYVGYLPLYAQNGIIINPDPSHFLINKGAIFPSSYNFERTQFSLLYQNKVGIFSDLRNIYADGLIKSQNKHLFGLKAYSEQETSLFSKSKVFLIYGYTLPISEKINWTSAAQIGLVNISFGNSSASPGGSDINLDGSLSSTFEVNSWNIGIALHQIPGGKLRPINYQFELKRYLDLYLSKEVIIDPTFKWETGLRIHCNPGGPMYYFDNNITYNNFAKLLLMANSQKRISLGGAFSIPNQINELRLLFNYEFPFNAVSTNASSISIGIYYLR